MNAEELSVILEKHRKWLCNKHGGERADLSGADLRGADLGGVNLGGADLRGADLRGADLCRADLCDADLRDANLRGANLCRADLCDADLGGVNLGGADLRWVNLNEFTCFYALQCPEKGEFTGFKKAGIYIVELKIPADAKRSSATSRKCRCNKALVVSITNKDGTAADVTKVKSDHDPRFVYGIGETVEVPDFDENRWAECSTGIHFFITREEAVQYG